MTEPYKIVLQVGDDYLSVFSTEDLRIEGRAHGGRALVKGKVAVTAVYVYNSEFVNG